MSQKGCGIVKISSFLFRIPIHKTDDDSHGFGLRGDFLERSEVRIDKSMQTEQVTRRISRKTELGEYREIRAHIPGFSSGLQYAISITADISNRCVDLRQRYFHKSPFKA
jgi:hypothetical protein